MTLIFYSLLFSLHAVEADRQPSKAELVEVKMSWEKASHNAFTDLIRFKGHWYCVFREGEKHVSSEGKLRVISSIDGKTWTSKALIALPHKDLRDPKITTTVERAALPVELDARLMLTAAAALPQSADFSHQSLVWFSSDGKNWSKPSKIGDPNMWLWRVVWHKDTAYSIGYSTASRKFIRLYKSQNGVEFTTLVDNLFDKGYPNETSMIFLDNDTCLCLLRRDGDAPTAQLGIAEPPYKKWKWKDLGIRIGGPHMLCLPDGRIVAAGRLYEGNVRTSLLWLDPDAGTLTEFLELPSGGDTSYPGLVFHNGLLWVSYYSSHEGKTSIYLAKVKLPLTKKGN